MESRRKVDRDEVRKMEEGIYGGGKERWRKERKMEEGIYEGREYMKEGREEGRNHDGK